MIEAVNQGQAVLRLSKWHAGMVNGGIEVFQHESHVMLRAKVSKARERVARLQPHIRRDDRHEGDGQSGRAQTCPMNIQSRNAESCPIGIDRAAEVRKSWMASSSTNPPLT